MNSIEINSEEAEIYGRKNHGKISQSYVVGLLSGLGIWNVFWINNL